jgi:hypothetical protein
MDAHISSIVLTPNLVLCCGKDGQLRLYRNRYEVNDLNKNVFIIMLFFISGIRKHFNLVLVQFKVSSDQQQTTHTFYQSVIILSLLKFKSMLILIFLSQNLFFCVNVSCCEKYCCLCLKRKRRKKK